jgi:hypothetical protein
VNPTPSLTLSGILGIVGAPRKAPGRWPTSHRGGPGRAGRTRRHRPAPAGRPGREGVGTPLRPPGAPGQEPHPAQDQDQHHRPRRLPATGTPLPAQGRSRVRSPSPGPAADHGAELLPRRRGPSALAHGEDGGIPPSSAAIVFDYDRRQVTCPQSQVGDSPAEVLASRQRVTLTAPKFPTEPSQKPLHTFADASSKRRPLDDACDLWKRYRTGSFVTVRPMTRRWISDVPPKIVKFLTCVSVTGRAEDQGSEVRSYLSSATVVVRRFQSASGAETEQCERSGLVWRTSPHLVVQRPGSGIPTSSKRLSHTPGAPSHPESADAPCRVIARHPKDQLLDRNANRRSSRSAPAGKGPLTGDQDARIRQQQR